MTKKYDMVTACLFLSVVCFMGALIVANSSELKTVAGIGVIFNGGIVAYRVFIQEKRWKRL